ncbi:MAG TPA: hypothetical protein VFB82_16755 [Blastocatellia bacterium]|nr:hypothetical protein [Blastocatellia bacterium]
MAKASGPAKRSCYESPSSRIPATTKLPLEKVLKKKLTINVDERVYAELQRLGGPEDISQLIESLVLPRLGGGDLEAAYEQMAKDTTREAKAHEWAEAMIGDADATR